MKLMILLTAAAVLILDSPCAAESVRYALELCTKRLIPGLFPLLIVSAMTVPYLGSLQLPMLAKLLKLPSGCEGLYLLGTLGGFPVGAVSIAQAVESGTLSKSDAERMLGLCSNCGPSFLFGVVACVLSTREAVLFFIFQLISALLLGAWWPGTPGSSSSSTMPPLSLTEAVQRGIRSMATICGWVILAAVLTGFAEKWVFPLLCPTLQVLFTGILELTGGVMVLRTLSESERLLIGTVLVCFGGISVLLQIRAVASKAGIGMKQCLIQKMLQAILSLSLCILFLRHGWTGVLLLTLIALGGKIGVEISGSVLYNTQRKEGI